MRRPTCWTLTKPLRESCVIATGQLCRFAACAFPMRQRLAAILGGVLALLSCALPVLAQRSYPMVMSLKPVAVQVDSTVECEVQSRYTLAGTHKVFVSGTGVVAEVVPPELPELKPGEKPKDLTKLKLKITVAGDAALGPREFRLATPNGASTIGQLVVVRDPVIVEQADNNTKETAQAVVLPATLCGAIEKNEDFDYWKFSAEAGQSIVFHVWAQRLQDKIHDLQNHIDPILFLRDAAGNVLAVSDNHFYADPCLSHTFASAGEYLLEVRDVRYQGNVYWEYCIEAHLRPFLTQVLPLAVAPDTETPVQLSGLQLGEQPTATVTTLGTAAGKQMVAVNVGGELVNPVAVHVTTLPRLDEPVGENDTLEQAVAITTPVVINGRIDRPADLDLYMFEAKKGETLSFEVLARRYDSNLDSYLRILNDKGNPLREDDDMRVGKLSSSDTWIEGWVVPADGKYFVEVRDVHLRGGPEFTYALQVSPSQPAMELAIDTDKTHLTPGTHGVIFVRATRKHGFAGEIALSIEGLPAGVTATCGRILAGKGVDGAIVLSAAPDASMDMARVVVRGTASHLRGDDQPPLELSAVAVPYQEIYMPGGGRGHYLAEDHVVCVGEPSDIRGITLSETDLRLKPGDSKKITITITRGPDATANISLDFLFQHLSSVFANTLPEGVKVDLAKSKTLLSGGASEGHITLTADKTAPPVEKQLCAVMANFSINFVMKATYSSPPVFISVTPAE